MGVWPLQRLLLLLCALVAVSLASSVARNPLRLLGTITDPQIHTSSKRVHAYSKFELSFSAYDGHRNIKLVLEPNHDILAEDAQIAYMGADGTLTYEPVDRLSHRIFKGVAKQATDDGSWVTVGWARASVLRDGKHPIFEGAFTVNHDAHHIQTRENYMGSKHKLDPEAELDSDDYMVIWRDSDVSPYSSSEHGDLKRSLALDSEVTMTCMSDDLEFNNNLQHPVYTELLRRSDKHWGVMPLGKMYGKRQIDSQPTGGNSAGVNLVSTIGQSQGCPNTKKVALVGVATDCTYSKSFNSTQTANQNIIHQMNSASSVWESAFNISLGLKTIFNSDPSCPTTPQAATPWNQDCSADLHISDRLNLFSQWRGQQQDSNSHWTLLSTCEDGAAVGLAWLGMACVHGSQTSNTTGGGQETVSGANVVVKTSSEWQVIAHETGHTFGAVHDCTSQTCQNSQFVSSSQCCPYSAAQCSSTQAYIMNPSTADNIQSFSPCTIGNICSAIGRNSINTTCLSANKGVVTISGQQCGNGIVEQGEDCDCGGDANCANNPCCDGKTCKFKSGAVCDDSNEDCCRNCQFAPATTVCRASTGECDPEEKCTGNTPTCPVDTTTPDGQSCTLNANTSTANLNTKDLKCASGQCTSRDLQCKNVMGAYTHGSNDTYACDSMSCTMSCASPAFGTGVCYGLQQNLLDGTPCGGGGHCSNGVCQGSTFGKEVQSWIDDHKGVVIGIACGVGALLLLAILSCCWSCIRRKPRKAKPVSPNNSWYSGGPMTAAGAMPPPPPPPMHGVPMRQQSQDQFGWYPPPQPPMAPAYHGQQGGWRPPPQQSYGPSGFRYA